MASIVETKAVALRRGTHPENLAFTGVQGEVVVDLGIEDNSGNLGTDGNTTLRLHNGITKGGIPMARADLLNVSTQLLAEERTLVNDKNLAYADLSNLEKVSATSTRNRVVSILNDYGLAIESEMDDQLENKANKNMSNVNTVVLATNAGHDGKNLAYADMSNVDTASLATGEDESGEDGHLGKNLAYADTSNINTANLATEQYHPKNDIDGNKPLAYYNFENTDTTNLTLPQYIANDTSTRPQGMTGPILARTDLDNVDSATIIAKISGTIHYDQYEVTTNKDTTINENNLTSGHYPETQAVVNYVSDKMFNSANTSLTNVIDWERLYSNSNEELQHNIVNQIDSQNGFELGRAYDTGMYLTDDPQEYLSVSVNVDSNGTITDLELNGTVGSIDLTPYNPFTITSDTDVDASFRITSTLLAGNPTDSNKYEYQIDSIIDGGSGFNGEDDYIVKSSTSNEYYKVIYNQLQVIPTQLTDIVQENEKQYGKIVQATCNPEYTFTDVTKTPVIITSSTNTTATLSIISQLFNSAPGAGVAKTDLTNLKGMTATDQLVEDNAPWRIRHDEEIPSLSETTIDSKQDYTIATNGNVWRALRNLDLSGLLANIPSVTFKAQFVPNTDYSNQSDVVVFDSSTSNCMITNYGKASIDKFTSYILLPNHNYIIQINDQNNTGQLDNYEFTTGNAGTTTTFEYSLGTITFNLNVQTATLFLYHSDGTRYATFNITNGTISRMITNDTLWEIRKEGYSSVSGTLHATDGNQTINVTLDEES